MVNQNTKELESSPKKETAGRDVAFLGCQIAAGIRLNRPFKLDTRTRLNTGTIWYRLYYKTYTLFSDEGGGD